MKNEISIEVAFALADHQELVALTVASGSNALEAVQQSGINNHFPDLDLEGMEMGIFSRPLNGLVLPLPADYVLEENDRVEIYRPLINDPKHARLERVRNEQRNLRKERDKINKERKIKRQSGR